MSKPLNMPAAGKTLTPAERRTQKLEAALRLNLKKRKEQGRERDADGADPENKGN
ncbi:MAG: hypothetical protein ABL901_18120 [Hyphomicrobiaceae bacterium]